MKLFKVKGDFREPRCTSGLVSVAKLGFSCVAKATKEKIAEVQWNQDACLTVGRLLADFQFDFKQLL